MFALLDLHTHNNKQHTTLIITQLYAVYRELLIIFYVIYLENNGVTVISCYKFHFE